MTNIKIKRKWTNKLKGNGTTREAKKPKVVYAKYQKSCQRLFYNEFLILSSRNSKVFNLDSKYGRTTHRISNYRDSRRKRLNYEIHVIASRTYAT